MMKEWLKKRANGVKIAFQQTSAAAKRIAWTAGTVILLVVYPLAVSILEDRVIEEEADDERSRMF